MRSWKMNLLVGAVALSFGCDKGAEKQEQPTATPAAAETATPAAAETATPAAAETANLPVVQYYALPG